MLDWPLTTGAFPAVMTGLGLLALAGLLAGRGRRWWLRRVPLAAAIGLAVGYGIMAYVDLLWQPWPDPLPGVVVTWLAVLAGAIALAVRRWPSWRGTAAAVAAVVLVLLAGSVQINDYFGAYPTARTAMGLPPVDQIPLSQVPRRATHVVAAADGLPLSRSWAAPAGLPARGRVTTAAIAGTVSGFHARPSWVYLPPAYLTNPRALLPVLVLVSGQPGSPRDWFDGGRLSRTMNTYAAAHAGLAPVVVVADPLGSELGKTLCVDSRAGNAFTYLSVDVPAWIRANLQVDPDARHWAVGGLSAGGTCALQLAVNAPEVYPTFLDISGQEEPTVGTRAQTITEVFGGDAAAFQRVNPMDVLASRHFVASAGFIVAGHDDGIYRPAAQRVVAATRSAHMDVRYLELPGGHSWHVWATGLEQALPWLAARFGLVA